MTVERFHLIRDGSPAGIADAVGEAVEALSLLVDRHYFRAGSREVEPMWWIHQWSDPETGGHIELDEILDLPLAWLVIRARTDDEAESMRQGLSELLVFQDAEELIAAARAAPADPIVIRRVGLGTDIGDERVIELLTRALHSPDSAVRQAAGEVAVMRRPVSLRGPLREAAARENDPNLAEAFRFAATRCDPDDSSSTH